jgi:hypothetical protein
MQSWLEKEYIQNEDGFSHVCCLSREGTIVIND